VAFLSTAPRFLLRSATRRIGPTIGINQVAMIKRILDKGLESLRITT